MLDWNFLMYAEPLERGVVAVMALFSSYCFAMAASA